jgi:hypothetical protein
MSWGITICYLTALFIWTFGRVHIFPVPHWVHEAAHELHPFMPYLMLAELAYSTWGVTPGGRAIQFAVAGLNLVCWFLYPDDDDDRWKRRRRRLASKVRSLGHRLVTVSAGAQ